MEIGPAHKIPDRPVGADADTALVEKIAITPANINDGKAGPEALPDNPSEVFADSAYRGSHFHDAVRAKGETAHIVATDMWDRDERAAQQGIMNRQSELSAG